MSAQFHWDPDNYLDLIRSEVPRFDELQERAVGAIEGDPNRILDLGIGTGETSRRVLEAFPDARITGVDSSPEMVFRARRMEIEVKLGRIEDPLPDGPWDLVIAVLSVHHLDRDQKRELFRRISEQSAQLVLADVVAVAPERRITPIDPAFDHPEPAADLARWCGGEVVWEADDLAVVRAGYRPPAAGSEA